ncbi:hypothetical protein [Salipiger abyssi]|uniref:Putative hydrolase of the metallo-beta-lactamase superfamily n=1 Tax=Salipiger abyssi TaxID=1250539 RepID=A0A1P8UWH0_9RHOB|nr:hypothetical protein [Salipiger abyssi]APZ53744.1 putative hydrolase of the metallo-beta-lactamase superfamily [Salipiger abyssi]
MPSKHEAAILALQSALSGHASDILREQDLPVECPENGVINIVPGDPEDVGAHLGTGRIEWQRPVELEAVVQGTEAAARNAEMDAALGDVAARLVADRTLAGAVDYLLLSAPEESDTVPMQGAESLKGAVLTVTLFYETTENPME